jgi:hypothetical protein
MVYLLKMVIFHGYVSLPEGSGISMGFFLRVDSHGLGTPIRSTAR